MEQSPGSPRSYGSAGTAGSANVPPSPLNFKQSTLHNRSPSPSPAAAQANLATLAEQGGAVLPFANEAGTLQGYSTQPDTQVLHRLACLIQMCRRKCGLAMRSMNACPSLGALHLGQHPL